MEEILRLIPGLYSFWLRAWGSRVGKLTYWAPQTVILDRGFLEIGDHVIFGAGVRINPHVMENNVLQLSTGENRRPRDDRRLFPADRRH